MLDSAGDIAGLLGNVVLLFELGSWLPIPLLSGLAKTPCRGGVTRGSLLKGDKLDEVCNREHDTMIRLDLLQMPSSQLGDPVKPLKTKLSTRKLLQIRDQTTTRPHGLLKNWTHQLGQECCSVLLCKKVNFGRSNRHVV